MANKKLICMHERDFEKQVQQKMEELSLMPSAPVWQKVEEQIRKKKDRRRLIFWLLPLLLAGGGGWWLLSGTGDRVAPTGTIDVTKQQPTKATPAPAHGPVHHTPSGENEESTASAPDQNTITAPSNTPKNYYLPAQAKQPKLTASSTIPRLQTTTAIKEEPALVYEANTISKPEASETKQNEAETQKDRDARQHETAIRKEKIDVPVTAADTANSFEKEATTGTTEVNTPAMPEIMAVPPVVDSASLAKTMPPQQLNIKKWQWTAHAELGVTSILAGLFELPSTRSYAAFDRPAQLTSGNFFAYYPSPQEEGLSFSVGATAKRLLSNRLKLTAGLQYSYYSTQMAVGQEKNAMATSTVPYGRQAAAPANSYLPGVQNDYTNRYHFIQLPVGVEYQVLRNLPLQVHGGIAVTKLVKTNALIYDFQTQAYYQNSSAYNASQWHLFSNITYTLWKGKSKKLDIGPYVQYSLTELQKTSSDKNRLFSTGLRTQVSF